MKTKLLLLLGCLALASSVTQAAQLGTAISYQGRLTDVGSPANGTHSFKYRLVADAAGATQIGPVVDLSNQNVSGGLFNASLDFGAGAFNGQERWLEISVKTGGPGAALDYIKLNPQPLPPAPSSQFARISGDVLDGAITGPRIAPLAITSGNLADGAVTSAKLGAGSVGSSQIADGSIMAVDIANNQIVKSLSINGSGNLRDVVNLVAGANIAFTPNGNNIQISASGTIGSLALPFTGTASSANPLFQANNAGNGASSDGLLGTTASSASQVSGVRGTATSSTGVVVGLYGVATASPDGTGVVGAGGATGGYFTATRPGGRAGVFDGNVTINGNVGIGTANPSTKLEVFSANGTAIAGKSTAEGGVGVYAESATGEAVHGETSGNNGIGTVGLNLANGTGVWGESRSQGIGVFGKSATGEAVHGETSGNTVAGAVVGVNLVNGTGVFGESRGQGVGVFAKSATGEAVHGESSSTFATVVGVNLAGGAGIYGESRGGGFAGFFAGNTYVAGNASVCTLTIRGGCDLAEPFPMKEAEIDKGSVVVIDEEHPGRLKLSTRAYDTQVAGIISGANGINPGISLTQEGALDQGQNVALTGRVYVKADASHGAIKPGDLLTTSDTPGHAMKVSEHTKSQGAILGKAMSALKEGTGLVLVLVTLQ